MRKMSGWEGLEASCLNISGAQGAFYWLHQVHDVSPTAEEREARSDSQCPLSGLTSCQTTAPVSGAAGFSRGRDHFLRTV